MKKHAPIPKNWAVKPLKPNQKAKSRATCGHCGLSWDDSISTSMTPTPSARCPFEAFHIHAAPKMSSFELVSLIHDNMELKKEFERARVKAIKKNPKLKKALSEIRFQRWEQFTVETADCIPMPDEEE
jgi:hypothetical protein